jgi:hypothetical protein
MDGWFDAGLEVAWYQPARDGLPGSRGSQHGGFHARSHEDSRTNEIKKLSTVRGSEIHKAIDGNTLLISFAACPGKAKTIK